MGIGDKVYAAEYNAIQVKAATLLGTGSGTTGYGQTLAGPVKAIGNPVAAAEWNALRNDIINIKLHQDGSQPTLTSPSTGDPIKYGSSHPNTSYNTMVDGALPTKFNIGAGRSVVTSKLTKARTGDWSVKSYCTATMTFTTAALARYYFNSAGKFRIASSRTDGTAKDQNTAWTNLLSAAGTVELGAQTSALKEVYELTDSYQVLYTATDTGAYTGNVYRISAKCDVANNSAATARIFYIYVEFIDGYEDTYPEGAPYDVVDGTLTVTLDEFKATGSMLPSGTFTITSPSYEITNITAS